MRGKPGIPHPVPVPVPAPASSTPPRRELAPRRPTAATVAAAVALLDRGWGKQKMNATVQGEVRVTLRKMLGDER